MHTCKGIFFYLCPVSVSTNRERFFRHVAQTSDKPLALEIDRAEGLYMYAGSKCYTDCISGISVSNIGHGNKAVAEAVKTQLEKHLHLMVYGEMVQASQTLLAEKLCGLLPPSLNSVYFVNSGSEAVEGAMKLAKRFTGRPRFTAQKDAYHGSTQGALSLMSNAYFSQAFAPLLPGIDFIEQNDLNSIDRLITCETAAVFIEPVMGEKGYVPCTSEYLMAIRKRCSETGAMLVFDEIQTAIGRTGNLFGFQTYGVVPDVLLLAKSFGGGLPLGAFVSSNQYMQVLTDKPVLGHITTFGGHPLSCAAALASLSYIIDEDLAGAVKAKEMLFRSLLVHPAIKHISGTGLMLAIDFEDPVFCRRVIDSCVEDGLLVDWFLYAEHKLRLAPPLIVTTRQIQDICGTIIDKIELCLQP